VKLILFKNTATKVRFKTALPEFEQLFPVVGEFINGLLPSGLLEGAENVRKWLKM
jgi:hypothetical protein